MFKFNWQEYLIEAWGLGTVMVVASICATLLFHPSSLAVTWISSELVRRLLMGVAMGMTTILIIYSPWGKRSGAHLNPAVTLTFYRLKKLPVFDVFLYVIFQVIGGLLGVSLIARILGDHFTSPPVNYLVTVPGVYGWTIALITEFILALILMLMVLVTSNINRWSNYTGIFAGILVACYIAIAAPISGMSINPARSFASAFPAQIWDFFWIYYFSPIFGMLSASELYLRYFSDPKQIICCKMCPNGEQPCISSNCCRFCNIYPRF